MRTTKRGQTILERVARCRFCGREVEGTATAQCENPFCRHCLQDRLAAASQALGKVTSRLRGGYVEFSTEGSRTPRRGV